VSNPVSIVEWLDMYRCARLDPIHFTHPPAPDQNGTLFGIEVEVKNPSPLLHRPTTPHKVIGAYVGCPACPWASSMMTMTHPVAS